MTLSPDRIDAKTQGWNYIFCRPGELSLLFVGGQYLRCQNADNAAFHPDKVLPDDAGFTPQSIDRELSYPPFVGGPDQYTLDQIAEYLVNADARADIHQVPLGWLCCATAALEFVHLEGPEGDTWYKNMIRGVRYIHRDNPEILELWPFHQERFKEHCKGMIMRLRGPEFRELEILEEQQKVDEWKRQKYAVAEAKKAEQKPPTTTASTDPNPEQELPEI